MATELDDILARLLLFATGDSSTYSTFEYGSGTVYGPTPNVLSVDVLTSTLIRFNLDAPIIVDDAFRALDNYIVVNEDYTQELIIKRVLPPVGARTTTEVLVVIDRMTDGTKYLAGLKELTSAEGLGVTGIANFFGRVAKAEVMLKGAPSHFDTRPDSLIGSVLTAIGLSDDKIGGTRSDDL